MRTGHQSLANTGALIFCCLLVMALILPAIAQTRDLARRSICASNLRRIALAAHNYHSAYKQLPAGCGGTTSGDSPESSNQGQMGPLVALLPFLDQQSLWKLISNPYVNPESEQTFPRMGPVPWYDSNAYKPWSQAPTFYTCPDSPHNKPAVQQPIVYTLNSPAVGGGVMTSYVACYGDGTFNVGAPYEDTRQSDMHALATKRGMFQPGKALKFRDCLDGLSQTLMYSETRSSVRRQPGTGIAKNVVGLSKNPSLCLTAVKDGKVQWWPFGRGARWCHGDLTMTGFQTVLPPNSPSCTSENGIHDAIASASSYHKSGVHALFADGSICFITDSIDSGDLEAPGVSNVNGYGVVGSESPYGLWGALGTRNGQEEIQTLLNRGAFRDPAQTKDQKTTVGSISSLSGRFEKWTSKERDISLYAKQLRIIDKKTIELKDTQGVIHQVPLNALIDRDMIRAVTKELQTKEAPQK
jgi:hypothetical protein